MDPVYLFATLLIENSILGTKKRIELTLKVPVGFVSMEMQVYVSAYL